MNQDTNNENTMKRKYEDKEEDKESNKKQNIQSISFTEMMKDATEKEKKLMSFLLKKENKEKEGKLYY
jgi:hypothetical protein